MQMGFSEGYSLHVVRHTMVTRLKELDVPAANIDREKQLEDLQAIPHTHTQIV